MSIAIWPPIAPEQLKIEEDATQARELTWLLATSLRGTLHQLRRGLEDSYALLAPVDPGSTLVLTTPRHETVKGHVTRVGTRLVRGAVSLKLRTLPPLVLRLSPARPLRLAPLQALHGLLTAAVDLLGELCGVLGSEEGEEEEERRKKEKEKEGKKKRGGLGAKEREDIVKAAPYLAERLKLLARQLTEASKILKGSPALSTPPPSSTSTPSSSSSSSSSSAPASSPPPALAPTPTPTCAIPGWTTSSASLTHFLHHHHPSNTPFQDSPPSHRPPPPPPLPRNLSVYLTIEDASLVLYVRSLEPAGAPTTLGAKLALAIGTARRLEHDEAERVFRYACDDESKPGGGDLDGGGVSTSSGGSGGGGTGGHFLGVGGAGVGGFLGVGGGGGGSSRPTSSSSSGTTYKMSAAVSSKGGHHQHRDVDDDDYDDNEVPQQHDGEQEPERAERPKSNHVDVYVREKVRVESADPSLLSLSAKLLALSNTLALARRNLAAVMGEEFVD